MDTNSAPFTHTNTQHERGPAYNSPTSWKAFTNESIEMLAGVLLDTATGASEQRLHGAVTMAFDSATVCVITDAINQIRQAIKVSSAHWLGHAEAHVRLPTARKDERFQSFLAGVVLEAPQEKKITTARKKRGAA